MQTKNSNDQTATAGQNSDESESISDLQKLLSDSPAGCESEVQITRIDTNHWRVNTGVFMSDCTYQEGVCELVGSVLKFKGWMNRMPFRINLGPVSRMRVLVLNPGQTVVFKK